MRNFVENTIICFLTNSVYHVEIKNNEQSDASTKQIENSSIEPDNEPNHEPDIIEEYDENIML